MSRSVTGLAAVTSRPSWTRPAGARAPASASSRAGRWTRRRRPSRSSIGASPGAPAWSATSRNAASGASPMSSDSASAIPSSAASSARTVSQTRHSGVIREVEQVHRDLGPAGDAALRLLDLEAVRLDLGQAAARLADPPGDALGELDVVAREVDVPGDEERPRTDRDGAGPRMHRRRARSPGDGRSGRSRP